jgi:molecular chaperone Hsp33
MADLLLVLAAPGLGLKLAVCTASRLAQEAAERHGLASGSAAALAQALSGALLLAATERRVGIAAGGTSDPDTQARVDVQLECGGPLRGLLVDADSSGAVRGLVRVTGLDRGGARVERRAEASFAELVTPGELGRFDARPLLATGHDERAGLLAVMRAEPGMESPYRASYPFAGADLGAALTLFLRNDRPLGGELALEVLYRKGGPLAAVGGALLWPSGADDAERVRSLGKPLRKTALHEAMLKAEGRGENAHAIARELAGALGLGPLHLESEVRPRFECRCSRARVVRALATLGAAELRDMAGKDGGAEATCDFCAASYRISATELLELAGEGPQLV